jgi:hypothetical protein
MRRGVTHHENGRGAGLQPLPANRTVEGEGLGRHFDGIYGMFFPNPVPPVKKARGSGVK